MPSIFDNVTVSSSPPAGRPSSNYTINTPVCRAEEGHRPYFSQHPPGDSGCHKIIVSGETDFNYSVSDNNDIDMNGDGIATKNFEKEVHCNPSLRAAMRSDRKPEPDSHAEEESPEEEGKGCVNSGMEESEGEREPEKQCSHSNHLKSSLSQSDRRRSYTRNQSDRLHSHPSDRSSRRRLSTTDQSDRRRLSTTDQSDRRRLSTTDQSDRRRLSTTDQSNRRRLSTPDQSDRRRSNTPDQSDRRRSNTPDQSDRRRSNTPDQSDRRRSNSTDQSHRHHLHSPDPSDRHSLHPPDQSDRLHSHPSDRSSRRLSYTSDQSDRRRSNTTDQSDRRRLYTSDQSNGRRLNTTDQSDRHHFHPLDHFDRHHFHPLDQSDGHHSHYPDQSDRRRSYTRDQSGRRRSHSSDASCRRLSHTSDQSDRRRLNTTDQSDRRRSNTSDQKDKRYHTRHRSDMPSYHIYGNLFELPTTSSIPKVHESGSHAIQEASRRYSTSTPRRRSKPSYHVVEAEEPSSRQRFGETPGDHRMSTASTGLPGSYSGQDVDRSYRYQGRKERDQQPIAQLGRSSNPGRPLPQEEYFGNGYLSHREGGYRERSRSSNRNFPIRFLEAENNPYTFTGRTKCSKMKGRQGPSLSSLKRSHASNSSTRSRSHSAQSPKNVPKHPSPKINVNIMTPNEGTYAMVSTDNASWTSPKTLIPPISSNPSADTSHQPDKNCATSAPAAAPIPQQYANLTPRSVSIPQETANIPQQTANISQPSANIPQPTANIPQPTANISQPSANIPQPNANISQPSANIPQQTANISQQTANIPQQFANIPQQFANIPQQFANIPQQFANISQQTANIPQQFGCTPQPPAISAQGFVNGPQPTINIPQQLGNAQAPVHIPQPTVNIPQQFANIPQRIPNFIPHPTGMVNPLIGNIPPVMSNVIHPHPQYMAGVSPVNFPAPFSNPILHPQFLFAPPNYPASCLSSSPPYSVCQSYPGVAAGMVPPGLDPSSQRFNMNQSDRLLKQSANTKVDSSSKRQNTDEDSDIDNLSDTDSVVDHLSDTHDNNTKDTKNKTSSLSSTSSSSTSSSSTSSSSTSSSSTSSSSSPSSFIPCCASIFKCCAPSAPPKKLTAITTSVSTDHSEPPRALKRSHTQGGTSCHGGRSSSRSVDRNSSRRGLCADRDEKRSARRCSPSRLISSRKRSSSEAPPATPCHPSTASPPHISTTSPHYMNALLLPNGQITGIPPGSLWDPRAISAGILETQRAQPQQQLFLHPQQFQKVHQGRELQQPPRFSTPQQQVLQYAQQPESADRLQQSQPIPSTQQLTQSAQKPQSHYTPRRRSLQQSQQPQTVPPQQQLLQMAQPSHLFQPRHPVALQSPQIIVGSQPKPQTTCFVPVMTSLRADGFQQKSPQPFQQLSPSPPQPQEGNKHKSPQTLSASPGETIHSVKNEVSIAHPSKSRQPDRDVIRTTTTPRLAEEHPCKAVPVDLPIPCPSPHPRISAAARPTPKCSPRSGDVSSKAELMVYPPREDKQYEQCGSKPPCCLYSESFFPPSGSSAPHGDRTHLGTIQPAHATVDGYFQKLPPESVRSSLTSQYPTRLHKTTKPATKPSSTPCCCPQQFCCCGQINVSTVPSPYPEQVHKSGTPVEAHLIPLNNLKPYRRTPSTSTLQGK